MKWLGWPRPPVILGFILGPIIEQNLWPSWKLWGAGFALRPVTIGLTVAAIISVTYLTRSIGKAGATAETVTGGVVPEVAGAAPGPTEGGEASPAGDPSPTTGGGLLDTVGGTVLAGAAPGASGIQLFPGLRLPRLRFGWRWETIFTGILLAIVAWFLYESQQLIDPAGRFLPAWISALLIPLLALQVLTSLFTPEKQGDIMDLGMRTGTGLAALKRLAYVVAWLAGLVVLSGLVELRYAAIAFALAFGLIHVQGRGLARVFGLIPAVLMAIVVFGIFGTLMVIDWPTRFILGWFQ